MIEQTTSLADYPQGSSLVDEVLASISVSKGDVADELSAYATRRRTDDV